MDFLVILFCARESLVPVLSPRAAADAERVCVSLEESKQGPARFIYIDRSKNRSKTGFTHFFCTVRKGPGKKGHEEIMRYKAFIFTLSGI